jgi:hypothetical protein
VRNEAVGAAKCSAVNRVRMSVFPPGLVKPWDYIDRTLAGNLLTQLEGV